MYKVNGLPLVDGFYVDSSGEVVHIQAGKKPDEWEFESLRTNGYIPLKDHSESLLVRIVDTTGALIFLKRKSE